MWLLYSGILVAIGLVGVFTYIFLTQTINLDDYYHINKQGQIVANRGFHVGDRYIKSGEVGAIIPPTVTLPPTSKRVWIDEGTTFSGVCVIGDSVLINSNCYITDSYIGEYTHIQSDCTIEETHVSASVGISSYCNVRNSYICKDSRLKHRSFVSNSHIGRMSFVGEHTTIYNSSVGNNVLISDRCRVVYCTLSNEVLVGGEHSIRGITVPEEVHVHLPENQNTVGFSFETSIYGDLFDAIRVNGKTYCLVRGENDFYILRERDFAVAISAKCIAPIPEEVYNHFIKVITSFATLGDKK